MPKRELSLILLAVAVLLTGALIFATGAREPSYKGRRLGAWLERYAALPRSERGEARDAIRQMGTNVIPWLLGWIEYEEPGWKEEWRERASPFLNLLRVSHDPPDDPKPKVAPEAISWFGPAARMAIPHLSNLVQNASGTAVATRAAYALCCMGEDGVPSLSTALTNPAAKYRPAYFNLLAHLGTSAPPVVPAFVQCLQDRNTNIAFYAALALGYAQQRADLAVPALAQTLNRQDQTAPVRCVSAEALSSFGQAARPVLSHLTAALRDPEVVVRCAVTNALLKIAPEVLTNALPPSSL